MSDTTVRWRSWHGAEYDDIREVPCLVITYSLLDGDRNQVDEDHPEVAAEITRRGYEVYRDHGYGAIPLVGCDHTDQTRRGA